jgi:uncharacterized protein YtpQ (UPF0354 family)
MLVTALACGACDRADASQATPSTVEQPVASEPESEAEQQERRARDEFGRGVATRIHRANPDISAVYDPQRFAIVLTSDDGGSNQANLTNIYDEYMQAPVGDKRALIDRFVQISMIDHAKEPLPSAAEARSMLVPMVRDRMYFIAGNEKSPIDPDNHMGGEGVGHTLLAHACFDYPDHIACVEQRTTIAKIGLDPDSVMEIAKDNLRARSAGDWERPAAGVKTYVSPWHDNHDASRLLLTDMIRDLKVKGEPIVMVPNRDTMVVTGSDDPAGLAEMAKVARPVFEGPRPLAGLAFRLTESGYEEWLPPPTHPSYSEFHAMSVLDRAAVYDSDKNLLDARHEAERVDIFVATCIALEHKQLGTTSAATWTRGVDTLLPRAEHLIFMEPDRAKDEQLVAMVPWSQAEPIVGKYMTATDTYPERYRVTDFPSKAELARLVKLDVWH